MAKKQENILFVKLSEGGAVHKDILESLKMTIESLQGHEKFKSVREEKSKALGDFKKDINALSKLLNKLKSAFPKQDAKLKDEIKKINARARKAIKEAEQETKKEAIPQEEPKEGKKDLSKLTSEIAKLESELNDVESKLSSFKQ